MALLGSVGKFYIILLFVFLVAGLGVLSLNFARKFWSGSESWLDKKGGKLMNKWLKLAVVSFAGLLVASFALGLINSTGGSDSAAMGAMGGTTNAAQSAHNHSGGQQQSGMDAAAGSPAGYNQDVGMGMNGMAAGVTNPNIEAQMYMMQNRIMQLQQQLGYMMQMFNQQGYGPGAMNGNMGTNPGMGNMGTSNSMNNSSMNMSSPAPMNNQSSSGSSGGGMGMGMM